MTDYYVDKNNKSYLILGYKPIIETGQLVIILEDDNHNLFYKVINILDESL